MNAFFESKKLEMTNITQVTTEIWEIGTTWEADWSHHATSLRADARAWYMGG